MKPNQACQLITLVAMLSSCGKKHEITIDIPAATPAPSEELNAVIEATPEGEPKSIHVLRASAAPGDAVTISGRVMGNITPFVEGRAAFTLGDPEVLTACSDMPDDPCETPWDACCDSREDKLRGTATIQVVDAEGRVLKEGIEGVGGINKLSFLKVSGTVAEGSTAESLVINAKAIDVTK